MEKNLGFAKSVVLFVTPLVASSMIAISPSWGATFASSEARVNIDGFSHVPLGINTLTDTQTEAITTNGEVVAEANASANFIASLFQTEAENLSFSQANGEGKSYFGLAQSQAGIIGYNFFVEAGETFSFDFQAFLDIETSIDISQSESASANGEIFFQLYDSSNITNWQPLESLTIYGSLITPGKGDLLSSKKSQNFTYNPSETAFQTSFGGKQESAEASVTGSFSRLFNNSTYLTLVEIKTNQANVNAIPVPESSNMLALLLFGLSSFGYRVRSLKFRD